MKTNRPTALFLDVGGVLLTNGWDRSMRQRAAETFKLDYDEMDERHHLTFDTYEEGKLSLNEYLKRSLSISSLPRASSVFANRMPISIACFRCRSSLTGAGGLHRGPLHVCRGGSKLGDPGYSSSRLRYDADCPDIVGSRI